MHGVVFIFNGVTWGGGANPNQVTLSFFMPNRVIRDWTTSEPINELSFEAEVFFTRLIMKADDHGNYTANPKLLKAALFPLRDEITTSKVESMLNECCDVKAVTRYEIEGKQYINIPNFGQRLRQMRSSYPQPADNPLTCGGQPADNVRPETKRNEVEVKVKAYGPTHSHFVIVKSKYLHEQTCRINGKAGLIEYMEANQTVLNLPHHGDKFMRANNGKVFNELSHLQNAYSLYIEKQFK